MACAIKPVNVILRNRLVREGQNLLNNQFYALSDGTFLSGKLPNGKVVTSDHPHAVWFTVSPWESYAKSPEKSSAKRNLGSCLA